MITPAVVPAAELVGRVLLGGLFVLEGAGKLQAYGSAGNYMQAFGVSAQLLQLVIALELGAGVLIIAGWHTRPAALLLAGFCALAAVIFHTRFADRNQLIHFEKDLTLASAFLIVAVRGSGVFSLDHWRAARSRGDARDADNARLI